VVIVEGESEGFRVNWATHWLQWDAHLTLLHSREPIELSLGVVSGVSLGIRDGD